MQQEPGDKLIKQGAEAKIYESNFLGRLSIIKERFVKKYRHPTLDSSLTKERIKSESRALVRCRNAGIRVPALYHVDLEKRLIIMENLENFITVRQYIQNIIQENPANKTNENLNLLMEILGAILYNMHSNSIIHGDLTTSNAMIDTSMEKIQIYLIDFGLSSICDSAESKAVDLYVLERAFHSSHPNSELLFSKLIDHYFSLYPKQKNCDVWKKLEDVRLRGRKRSMVG